MMLRKAGMLFTLCLLAASPAFGQAWARKMFKETSHDFGPIARGAKAEFEFPLSNLYLEDVHIARVRSSCGCTQPRIKKEWLKTYEQGSIIAAINSTAFSGQRSATVTVTIDKPFHAEVQLNVRVFIRNDVTFSPNSAQLGTVDEGTPAEKRVTVTYSGRSDWKILDVRSANPHITAEVVSRQRRYGRVAYDLLVHLDRNAPAGYLKDYLTLRTNDSRSQVPLLVEGKVASAITVSPSTLFMGVVEPGKKVTKQLIVKGKRPFRILSITCEGESFEFGEPTDDVPKRVHLIPVTFVAGEDTGKIAQTIRIETDLGEMTPELAAYAVVTP